MENSRVLGRPKALLGLAVMVFTLCLIGGANWLGSSLETVIGRTPAVYMVLALGWGFFLYGRSIVLRDFSLTRSENVAA